MKQKIVIITSKYLHPFVEKAFEDFKEDCTVTIADYTNFDHITAERPGSGKMYFRLYASNRKRS